MLDFSAFREGLWDFLPLLVLLRGESREVPALLLPLLLPDFFLETERFLEKVISESSVWPSFSYSPRNFFWKQTFFFSLGASDSLLPLGYSLRGSESVPMRYLRSISRVVSFLWG